MFTDCKVLVITILIIFKETIGFKIYIQTKKFLFIFILAINSIWCTTIQI